MEQMQFTRAQLDKVFPLWAILSNDLTVVDASQSFRELTGCGETSSFSSLFFTNHYQTNPLAKDDFETLSNTPKILFTAGKACRIQVLDIGDEYFVTAVIVPQDAPRLSSDEKDAQPILQMERATETAEQKDTSKQTYVQAYGNNFEVGLQDVIDNLNEAVCLINENCKIQYCNSSFATFFSTKWNAEYFCDKDIFQILNDLRDTLVNADAVIEKLSGAINTRSVLEQFIVETTSKKYCSMRLTAIKKEHRHTGFIWTLSDVSYSIAYEQELLEQKNYYQKILNVVPADFVLLDKEGKFVFVNKSAFKNEDVRNWVIGRTNMEYGKYRNIPDDVVQKREKLVQNAINKMPGTTIDEYPKPDGSTEYVLRKIHPYVNEAGEVEFIIVYGIDITEQEENFKLAALQEKRITNLLEIINDGVFRADANGAVNLWNQSFSQIFGLPANIQNTSSCNIYNLIPAEYHSQLNVHINALLAGGSHQNGSFSLTSANGTKRFFEYVLTSADNEENGAITGSITDVTEIANKDANYKELIAKEKKLNKDKSNFIKISSHELRTPLTIIQTNAEILEMQLTNNTLAGSNISGKVIDRIGKEIIHMTDILNQLLVVSQIHDNNLESVLGTYNFKHFITSIVNNLYAPSSDGRMLQLELSDDIATFRFDKNLMRLAIINLLNNAFKFSAGSEQPPIMRVCNNEENISIEVEDFGIGIPELELLVFQSTFARGSNAGTIQGIGLGLMIIDYVVAKHNGTIKYSSIVNKGTKFTIHLPKNK
jgi:PAS domain S-box-containing protein